MPVQTTMRSPVQSRPGSSLLINCANAPGNGARAASTSDSAAVWSGYTAALGPKLEIVESHGPNAVQKVYLDTLKGAVRPSQAHMLSLIE